MDDDNDLTDRYNEIVAALEGNTLEDSWEDNPDPPPTYGKPDPRTIIEEVGRLMWAWHTENKGAEIQFDGNSVPVKQ